MALQLNKDLPSGLSGNYWRITDALVSYMRNGSVCKLSLYKDQAAREAGKEPILEQSYAFDGAENPFTPTDSINVLEALYDKLKALPEFDGSEDV